MNCKRSLLSSRDTFQAKTNRHLDKGKDGKGWWGGDLRILKKQQMTFSKFSSLSLVFLALCVSFSVCASPSPSFPLTLPLMVIYLVGKGFAFSPERTTTGWQRKREEKKKRDEQPQKKKEQIEGVGTNCRKERKYTSLVSVSPVTPTLPLSLSLTAVIEVKVWPKTVRGEKKKNYMSIFVPTGCLDRNRYITFS